MQSGLREADSFLYSRGLNSQALVSSARTAQSSAEDALTTAKPSVNSLYNTLSTSSPTLLAEYAVGLVALYYLVRLLLWLMHGHI